MACEVGDVSTVEVLLSFPVDLSIREKVRDELYLCFMSKRKPHLSLVHFDFSCSYIHLPSVPASFL